MGELSRTAREDIEETRRLLAEQGFSLDELIESGREIRGELLREMHGIDPDAGRGHASSSITEKDQWHGQ
jgi:hypothetical protein